MKTETTCNNPGFI